jgi:hypothetical protein
MGEIDSKIAGLWARVLRAGSVHPLTMAALLLTGPRRWHKRTGAPRKSASPACPTCCDCVPGKFPTLIASSRAFGGKNLS